MELYEVTVEYVKYLRKFEPTKIMSNADGKELNENKQPIQTIRKSAESDAQCQ